MLRSWQGKGGGGWVGPSGRGRRQKLRQPVTVCSRNPIQARRLARARHQIVEESKLSRGWGAARPIASRSAALLWSRGRTRSDNSCFREAVRRNWGRGHLRSSGACTESSTSAPATRGNSRKRGDAGSCAQGDRHFASERSRATPHRFFLYKRARAEEATVGGCPTRRSAGTPAGPFRSVRITPSRSTTGLIRDSILRGGARVDIVEAPTRGGIDPTR